MPSFHEAQKIILDLVHLLPPVNSPLLAAVNMVACEPVPARWDLPMFDNSAMDGFAVRGAECAAGRELAVAGTVMAGDRRDSPLPLFSTIKIMTGAPLPSDCDAVIPFEDVRGVFRPLFKGILDREVHKKAGKANLLRIRVRRDGELFMVGSAGNQQTGCRRPC